MHGGGGGGATPRFWTPTTPPTNCWPEAPWVVGGGAALEGGFREGRMGGGSRGGAGGGGGLGGSVGRGGGSRWGNLGCWGGRGGTGSPYLPLPSLQPYHHHKLNPNLCSQLVWPCQPC